MEIIYEIGRTINYNYDLGIDEKLKFSRFPYRGSEVLNTSLFVLICFLLFALFVRFLFGAEILLTTFSFFGFVAATVVYVYPTHIYYLNQIVQYKKEMLNTIMRFSMYLSMKSNMEFALHNSLEHMNGILKFQFEDILLKLERKEFLSLGEGFKEYSLVWNKFSPEFVDSLKLLEVASMSSHSEAEKIMEESIEQIILSYNIEQKRNSEILSEKISRVIMAGIMFPIMILMLVPLISVFMPDVIKASALFLGFNILIPFYLLINGLEFSATRLQLSNIDIENDSNYVRIPKKIYFISILVFLIFAIPSFIYLMYNPPSQVDFESFTFETIFFVWLIPAGISVSIFVLTYYYYYNNKKIYERHVEVEEDIPHLLNYFNTYLSLNIPMENIFNVIVDDYRKHGFKNHPSVFLLEKISFKLSNLKTNLGNFIKFYLKKFSSVKSFNEILNQIVSFNEFSLREAAKVSKKIRQQRINIIKLNDYILTLLNNSISLVSSTMTMLSPLLSAMAIVMSLFVVTFIKFLSQQLSVIANLGSLGGNRVQLSLIDIEEIISPVYLQLIIGFYVVEIILILAMIKSNMKYGYSNYNIIKSISEGQIGFLIFTLCLFGGYFVFKYMFTVTVGVNLG